jgi:predicted TPR repeat methyltransferase
VFEALVGATPGRAVSWNHLALALVGLGRWEDAAAALRRSLELAPAQVDAWNSLANALLQLGRHAEAEAACVAALTLDAANVTAWQARAMASDAAGDFPGAAEAFARAVALEGPTAATCANLGAALLKCGRVEDAADALAAAVALDPAAGAYRDAKAVADLMMAATTGRALEPPPGDVERTFKTALLLLDAGGRREAAGRVAEAWAAFSPGNVEALHLRDAVLARPVERQPPELVAQRFDEMAEAFDEHLVVRLGYEGPEHLRALIAPRIAVEGALDVLDIGCGTGLSGAVLKPLARRLVGVDLSAGMLAKAQARAVYDDLQRGDLLDALTQGAARWDLIVALDTFPYLGALEATFDAAAQALKPGGWFAFSTEAAGEGDYVLRGNGRYAHSRAYIARLAGARFAIEAQATAMLRREAGRALDGGYFLLRLV